MVAQTIERTWQTERLPDLLTIDVLDGVSVYRKGYQAVLRHEKKTDDIMGSSSLQSLILWYLSRIVLKNLDDRQYYVFTGEPGLHLETNNNFSGDLLIYKRGQVSLFDSHYFDAPPLVNVEIDVEIDNTSLSDYEYIQRKTSNLLRFGVQRVIWVLSFSKQVIVAEPEKDWLVIDWHKDIELFDGFVFNIPGYFAQEGLAFGL
jgi:Uma2 family endonuclease